MVRGRALSGGLPIFAVLPWPPVYDGELDALHERGRCRPVVLGANLVNASVPAIFVYLYFESIREFSSWTSATPI